MNIYYGYGCLLEWRQIIALGFVPPYDVKLLCDGFWAHCTVVTELTSGNHWRQCKQNCCSTASHYGSAIPVQAQRCSTLRIMHCWSVVWCGSLLPKWKINQKRLFDWVSGTGRMFFLWFWTVNINWEIKSYDYRSNLNLYLISKHLLNPKISN